MYTCVDFFQKYDYMVSLYKSINWCITLYHILYIGEDESPEFTRHCSKLKLDEGINKLSN
jgi:hypothetical protein